MERIKNWARKIRNHNFVKNQIREHDSFETPEDRFREFLTEDKKVKKTIRIIKAIDKIIDNVDEKSEIEINKDLQSIFRKHENKIVIDKALDKIDINFEVKLEAQFEKDFPGRKAIWKGNVTGLFKKWLQEHNQFDNYFNIANDFMPKEMSK